jgi:hypothetical protein
MKKATENGRKIYILKTKDGIRKLTVPAEWKITYGKLHGGREDGKYGGSGEGNVLRIYESKEKQRAVFTGVQEFIDASLGFEKLVTNKEEKLEVLHSRGITDAKEQRKYTDVWIPAYFGVNSVED